MEFTETEYGFIKIEDSILIFIYKPQELFDAEMADQLIDDRLEFTGRNFYPMLADIRGVKSFTADAREAMAKKGNELVSAVAILIESPVERMIANTYVNVNKPKKPTRTFTNEKRALKWLSQFVKKNEEN